MLLLLSTMNHQNVQGNSKVNDAEKIEMIFSIATLIITPLVLLFWFY